MPAHDLTTDRRFGTGNADPAELAKFSALAHRFGQTFRGPSPFSVRPRKGAENIVKDSYADAVAWRLNSAFLQEAAENVALAAKVFGLLAQFVRDEQAVVDPVAQPIQ